MTILSLPKAFLLFIFYSFLGWICECIYCSTLQKRIINRGMLHGPYCPVYGFGGMLVIYMLTPWKDTWIPLFFAAMIITSVLEYITSWILESVFSAKWWDYSHYKLNINGRVCLLNSLMFGVLGTVAVHFIHPPIISFLDSLSDSVIKYLASAIAIIFTIDFVITMRKLVNFSMHMARFHEFSDSIKERFENEKWFKSSNLSTMFDTIKEQAELKKAELKSSLSQKIENSKASINQKLEISKSTLEKIEQFTHSQKYIENLISRFPTMSSIKYAEQIALIRKEIDKKLHRK